MQGFLQKRWVYHILIWVIIFLLIGLLEWIESFPEEGIQDILFELLELSPAIYIVYFNFAIKTHFFDKRKYAYYVLAFLFLVFSGVLMLGFVDQLIGVHHNSKAQNLINVLAIIPISLGLQYFKRGIINQFQLQELKAKTTETELNSLKAQINPHFLFNTLNNIYGINKIDAEKGSEMILELSDVMRYHLEISKKEMILLEDEIQLLKSYIELEKLRLNPNCNLTIDFKEVDKSLSISPLLFLPFVENAFKHGTHPIHPCYIILQMKTEGRKIFFDLKNSIIPNKKTVKTNIGLENTKRRLEMIYGDKHKLICTKDRSAYRIGLIIAL